MNNGLGVGYIANRNEEVVLLTQSNHIKKALQGEVEVSGLNKLCLAYFETSIASLMIGNHSEKLLSILRNPDSQALRADLAYSVRNVAFDVSSLLFPFAESAEEIDMVKIIASYHVKCIGSAIFDYDLSKLKGEHKAGTIRALNFLLHEIPKQALSKEDPFGALVSKHYSV